MMGIVCKILMVCTLLVIERSNQLRYNTGLHFYCFQTEVEVAEPSWARKLLSLIISKDEQSEDDGKSDERPGNILITTAAT